MKSAQVSLSFTCQNEALQQLDRVKFWERDQLFCFIRCFIRCFTNDFSVTFDEPLSKMAHDFDRPVGRTMRHKAEKAGCYTIVLPTSLSSQQQLVVLSDHHVH